MKRLSRAFACLLFSAALVSCSQKEPNLETLITHIRKDYKHEHYSVSPSLAVIFIDETLPGGNELKALMDSVTSLEVLVFSNSNAQKDKLDNLFNAINRRLDRQDLTSYGKFRSTKETVDVWAVANHSITNLVVVNKTDSFLYLVHFKGDIDDRKIKELVHPENRPILEYLYRIKPKG